MKRRSMVLSEEYIEEETWMFTLNIWRGWASP